MYCTFKILHTTDIMHMTLYIGHCCMCSVLKNFLVIVDIPYGIDINVNCAIYVYYIMILLKSVIFVLRMH